MARGFWSNRLSPLLFTTRSVLSGSPQASSFAPGLGDILETTQAVSRAHRLRNRPLNSGNSDRPLVAARGRTEYFRITDLAAGQRASGTWREFLRAQWRSVLAVDFFTV